MLQPQLPVEHGYGSLGEVAPVGAPVRLGEVGERGDLLAGFAQHLCDVNPPEPTQVDAPRTPLDTLAQEVIDTPIATAEFTQAERHAPLLPPPHGARSW
jgi:hypothetical protein